MWLRIRGKEIARDTLSTKSKGWATERFDRLREQNSGLFSELKLQFRNQLLNDRTASGSKISIFCGKKGLGQLCNWTDGLGRWASLWLIVPHRLKFASFILKSSSNRSIQFAGSNRELFCLIYRFWWQEGGQKLFNIRKSLLYWKNWWYLVVFEILDVVIIWLEI